MATLNYAFKELSCKIVYYGCGLCGKTTNLIHIHKTVPGKYRGELVSLATEQDRTLFFDFLPLDLGEVKGFKTKFQLYTVPGQVYYNATRKLVLRGVDGIVFVVDSQRDRFQENLDSFENLKQNLAEYGYHLQETPEDLDGIPWVLQFNKRDMPHISELSEMNEVLNPGWVPHYESVALTGAGVKDTLKGVSSLVIKRLNADSSAGLGQVPAGPAKSRATAGAPSGTGAPRRPPVRTPPPAQPAPTGGGDYDAVDEAAVEKEVEADLSRQKPAAAKPAPPQPAAPAQPAATMAPTTPQLNIDQRGKARWRGMRLGSANLKMQNMEGGQEEMYQLTGVVSFFGVFKSTWSRLLKYQGEDTRNVDSNEVRLWRFSSTDEQYPHLEVHVNGQDQALYINYLGRGGEVTIHPEGKSPVT